MLFADYRTYILITVPLLTLVALTAWVARVRGGLPDYPEPREFNQTFYALKWYKRLNLGAFLLSPFWLYANGFWLLAAAYVVAAFRYPWLATAMSIYLLFRASNLSWAGGKRWANDVEAFRDEQTFWSTLGVLSVFIGLMISD